LDYAESNLFASVNYRVINPENSIHIGSILSDLDGALKKIYELAKASGVNVKDFILFGHSAGGHIALLYGYKNFQANDQIKIAACISLAGPTDFTDDTGWSSMTMWGKNVEERLSFLSWMGSRLTKHPIELKQHNWTKQTDYSQIVLWLLVWNKSLHNIPLLQ
jgi:acetyl esterase/lipase